VIRGPGGAPLGLVRGSSGFRLFLLATLASSVGTWLAFVALVIDVYDRTDDARWVSALLIVDFLPIVASGLFAGPLVDRLPRRTILVASDLARVAVFCVLPFTRSALQIVLLAFVAGVATSFFRPAAYAGLPNLVADGDLPAANGLIQSAENLALTFGPIVGGGIAAAAGPHPAYWFNAATFAVSALLILRIRRSLEEERPAGEGHWRELRAGLRLIRGSKPLVTVLVAWSLAMLALAGINVSEVVLAKDVFDAGSFGYGLMLGAAGLGLLGGSLAAGGWIEVRGVRFVYPIAVALMGIGFSAAAAAPNVWVASFLVVVSGFGNGTAVVCNALLVQRGVADRFRGRAFTLLMSTGYAVLGLGMVGAGPLTNAVGARDVWGIAAGLCTLAAIAGVVTLAGFEDRSAPADVEPGAGDRTRRERLERQPL
jgi:MFS family permease